MIDTRRKYIIVLAIASAIILAVGSRLRPAPDAERGPDPTPSDLERLAQLAQRRTVEDSARYLASVADRAAASLVRVETNGLTGVVWGAGLVVTANVGSRTPPSMDITTFGRTHTGRTAAGGPVVPVVTVHASPLPDLAASLGAPESLEPGTWVLAVWRGAERRAFASGHFVGMRSESSEFLQWREVASTVALTPEMLGGGVFDLNGALLGVILSVEGRLAVVASSSLEALTAQTDTFEAQVLAQYGMRVGPLTDAEREHLRAGDGLVVREVWDGYPAEISGLAPGDVILSVNGAPVSGLADLAVLTSAKPSTPPVLGVRWRSATRAVTLTAASGTDHEEPAFAGGLGWELPPRGYRIAMVAPGSRAAEAGLRAGDRLLRIDRVEPRSLQQVERLLANASGEPRFFEVRRGHRRLGTLF